MARARRVTPHESERRARAMLWHAVSSCTDAPERSDAGAALRAALSHGVHTFVPALASSVRMDVPCSSKRMAP